MPFKVSAAPAGVASELTVSAGFLDTGGHELVVSYEMRGDSAARNSETVILFICLS